MCVVPCVCLLTRPDVANAFATSVGSRTLKLKWAIVIALVSWANGAGVTLAVTGAAWQPLCVLPICQLPGVIDAGFSCLLCIHHCLLQVMETIGAVFLGGSVSSTISGGVADPLTFANTPDIFAYGTQAAERVIQPDIGCCTAYHTLSQQAVKCRLAALSFGGMDNSGPLVFAEQTHTPHQISCMQVCCAH